MLKRNFITIWLCLGLAGYTYAADKDSATLSGESEKIELRLLALRFDIVPTPSCDDLSGAAFKESAILGVKQLVNRAVDKIWPSPGFYHRWCYPVIEILVGLLAVEMESRIPGPKSRSTFDRLIILQHFRFRQLDWRLWFLVSMERLGHCGDAYVEDIVGLLGEDFKTAWEDGSKEKLFPALSNALRAAYESKEELEKMLQANEKAFGAFHSLVWYNPIFYISVYAFFYNFLWRGKKTTMLPHWGEIGYIPCFWMYKNKNQNYVYSLDQYIGYRDKTLLIGLSKCKDNYKIWLKTEGLWGDRGHTVDVNLFVASDCQNLNVAREEVAACRTDIGNKPIVDAGKRTWHGNVGVRYKVRLHDFCSLQATISLVPGHTVKVYGSLGFALHI